MEQAVIRWTLLLSALVFLAGCSSTQMAATWHDPNVPSGSVKKVFVIGVAKDQLNRRLVEDKFAAKLASLGSRGVQSYNYFSDTQLKDDKDAVMTKVRELGCDAVLVTMATGSRTETVITPGRTYGTVRGDSYRYERRRYTPSDRSRRGWDDYYRSSFDITHEPATTTDFKIVTMESNLYNLDKKLIWSAQAETVIDKPVGELITEFVDEVGKDMAASGLF